MLRIAAVVAVVVFAGLLSASTHAQQAPAELAGQAVDQAGGVLADAAIEAPPILEMSAQRLDQIPKGRTFQSLAGLAPSVSVGELEGGIQAGGASGAENAFTIDDVRTASVLNGASRQNLAFEIIDEVQIATAGVPAEFSGALGGVVAARTRSGADMTRGEGHYSFEGSPLTAGPPKRLVLDPFDLNTTGYIQDPEQRDQRHETGGSIGGPILRRHLWYFGALSAQIQHRTNVYRFSDGAEDGTLTRRRRFGQAFGKVHFSSRHVGFSTSLLLTPGRSAGTLPPYDGTGPGYSVGSRASSATSASIGYRSNQASSSQRIDFVLRNSTLTARAGYFSDSYEDTGVPQTTSWLYVSPCCQLPLSQAFSGPAGTRNTNRVQSTSWDKTQHGSANVDYAYQLGVAGTHHFKAGVGVERTKNSVRRAYPGGYVNVYWGSTFVAPDGARSTGTYGYYEIGDLGTIGQAGASTTTSYVQDFWQATRRLSINVGVRAADEKVPSFRTDLRRYLFHFRPADTVSPRLSIRYGDGSIVLFSSWGRYVDWTKYELSRNAFGGNVWRTWYRSLDDPGAFQNAHISVDGECAQCAGRDLWDGPGSFRDRNVPDFSAVDPTVRPMAQSKAAIGISVRLRPLSTLSVQYVHNHLNRAIEDIASLVDGKETLVYGNPGDGAAGTMFGSGRTTPFATPRARREYDAVLLGWTSYSRQGFVQVSYTGSRLWGNYSGLANSDEIRTPTVGAAYLGDQAGASISRPGGNENSAWDLDEAVWDAHGHLDPKGRLATDRPHVINAQGARLVRTGTSIGASFHAASGTPLTTAVVTANRMNAFVNGRGDMGRTPVLTQTDILVSHEMKRGTRTVRVELNVLNVFNQRTARHIFNYYNRGAGTPRPSSAIDLSPVDLRHGYDYAAMVAATPDAAASIGAMDPRYGKADFFNPPLEACATARFTF